jgi:hypothetical protein
MSISRKSYASDVSDDEWALVAPYLTLLPEQSGQRVHGLREVFNGLRYINVRFKPKRGRLIEFLTLALAKQPAPASPPPAVSV